MQTASSSPKAPKNKTLAAWLAFITGQFGVHRLYLFGLGDVWAWVHPIAAALLVWTTSSWAPPSMARRVTESYAMS